MKVLTLSSCFKIFLIIKYIDIPIIPPKVLVIISLMSLAPIAKMYWNNSNINDITAILIIFWYTLDF